VIRLDLNAIIHRVEQFSWDLLATGLRTAVAEGEITKSDLLQMISEELGELHGPTLWGLSPGDQIRISGKYYPYVESDLATNRVRVMTPLGPIAIFVRNEWGEYIFDITTPRSKYRRAELQIRTPQEEKTKLNKKVYTRRTITANSTVGGSEDIE